MLVDVSASAIEAAREKRATLGDRKAKMLELVSGLLVDGRLSKQIVIWVHLNDEQTEVERN